MPRSPSTCEVGARCSYGNETTLITISDVAAASATVRRMARVGYDRRAAGDLAGALHAYGQALEVWSALLARNDALETDGRADAWHGKAALHAMVGDAYESLGDPEGALNAYRQAARAFTQAHEARPTTSALQDLAIACHRIGLIADGLGRPGLARGAFRRASDAIAWARKNDGVTDLDALQEECERCLEALRHP